MSLRIRVMEEIERNCCNPHKNDLVRMRGYSSSPFMFCRHCGRHWCYRLPTPEWPHTLTKKQRAEAVEAALAGEEWRSYEIGCIYTPELLPWETDLDRIELPCGCSVNKREGIRHLSPDCDEKHWKNVDEPEKVRRR